MDEEVLIQGLKSYWGSTDTEIRPGASAEEIAAFEARHGVRLPSFMRRFYSEINGTVGMDEDHIVFWPLQEIVPAVEWLGSWRMNLGRLSEELPGAYSYFVYADYLISSREYAVRLSNSQRESAPVIWILETSWEVLADSCFEFFVKYLENPEQIAMP